MVDTSPQNLRFPAEPGNADVVLALERIADLLEVRGENPYKVRAYRTAAAQVENLGTRELRDIAVEEGGLRGLGGFGAAIADKVGELLATGHLPFLEELEAQVPVSLLEITTLPNVGPRTAALLWHEAGITTLADLEDALVSGRLTRLPRLAGRSLDNLRRAIEQRRAGGARQRSPRERAGGTVDELLGSLRTLDATQRAEVAGSYRRGRATVGDLDIVVATERPAEVLDAVASMPGNQRLLLRGSTKCSVVRDGMQVDTRAVSEEQFGAAWQYFTGSQAHNVRLRGLALRRGLTLNEYGVFRLDGGARVAGATEEEVYAALGLHWIPPEAREDRGEIEAARLEPGAPAETRA